MKKSILSALGLAVALAFSMPALGNAATTTTAAPAASTTTHHCSGCRTLPLKPPLRRRSSRRPCKVTKKHKCPVKKAPEGRPEGCSEEP